MNVGALNGKGEALISPNGKELDDVGANFLKQRRARKGEGTCFRESCQTVEGVGGGHVANSPVDPAEDLRIVGVGAAVGDAVGPVLGEAVLLRHRLQPGRADRQLHHDVGLVGAHVVAPQRRQGLVHAPGACRSGGGAVKFELTRAELEIRKMF